VVHEAIAAEHQSHILSKLKQEFSCTKQEEQIISRGRNAASGSSKNRRDPTAYQDATALEALIGYLFITDSSRCRELLAWIHESLDNYDVKD